MLKLHKLHLWLNNSLVEVESESYSLQRSVDRASWSSSAWIQASVSRKAGSVSPQSALEHNPARNMTLSQARNRYRAEVLAPCTVTPHLKILEVCASFSFLSEPDKGVHDGGNRTAWLYSHIPSLIALWNGIFSLLIYEPSGQVLAGWPLPQRQFQRGDSLLKSLFCLSFLRKSKLVIAGIICSALPVWRW